jgi:peptidoglycan hydrolase-like protein with peptidoglycan-binding domain
LNLELSQDILLSDPVDQGEEKTWDTVGGATERSQNPAPTTEVTVPEAAQQAAFVNELQASTKERRSEPSSTAGTVEPEVAHVEEEAPAEAGIIDIASILGTLTVTVVQSSL